ncbi:MAG: hypothetical protein JST39_05285, partial [Bacteroidetes bacterium]|nr:hypothetical protein [Bacteroidota bacterium]
TPVAARKPVTALPVQEEAVAEKAAAVITAATAPIAEPVAGPAITAGPSKKEEAAPRAGGAQYLGKNLQRISILVKSPKEAYLPENELSFLTAILQACRLNLGDVAIVNHARQPMSVQDLREQLESRFILVFGVPLSEPELAKQPSFVPLALDGCSVVLAPPLSQLNNASAEAKQLKSKLWICLKQLFNV